MPLYLTFMPSIYMYIYAFPVYLAFVSFVINDVLHTFFFRVTVFIFTCACKILFIHNLKILHSYCCIHKTHFSHFVHACMLSNHNDYGCSLTTGPPNFLVNGGVNERNIKTPKDNREI